MTIGQDAALLRRAAEGLRALAVHQRVMGLLPEANRNEQDASTLEALAARLPELERDAARYRWLRDKSRPEEEEIYIGCDGPKFPGHWALVEVEADAAIDAAIQEQPK